MAVFECASCKATVRYEGRLPAHYPFCSERCRLTDLGRWFREQYAIDRELSPDEVIEPRRHKDAKEDGD